MNRLALAALFVACSEPQAPVVTRPLASDGVHLRDEQGRVALLRGINARVKGVFDVTFDDGRVALEEIPELTVADCVRMRQLGFDLLRLPIQWSGVEPVRGSYDEAYLARVDAAVACAEDAGMLVVIDLHQDAYSKEIGEDGAPLWAIQPPPAQLLEGPLTDLGDRRLSAQVRAAFATFFAVDDAAGLQAAFAEMLGHVAVRYADAPAVIGFELFNEPDAGTDEVAAFHARAAVAVRAAAPGKLVMFEPPALRNLTDYLPGPLPSPFDDPAAVYAPHIYTYVFQADQTAFQQATLDQLEGSVRAARDEATAFGTPLWIGEFGVGPDLDDAHERWMQLEGQLHERYFASNAFWVWKEQSQGSWGLFDYDASGTWTERPAVIARVSRIHVARVGGTPAAIEASAAGDELRLELVPGSATAAPHLVYIPERFAATARITCDGVALPVARDAATGLAEAQCDGVLIASALPISAATTSR